MPIGGDFLNAPPRIPQGRQIVTIPTSAQAPAPPSRSDRGAGDEDTWHPITLRSSSDPDFAADWTNGVAVVTFGSDVTKLEVFATEALFIAVRTSVSPNPGGYSFFHPGGGELVKVCPPTRQIAIRTSSGTTPVDRVELLGLGGTYALRP